MARERDFLRGSTVVYIAAVYTHTHTLSGRVTI